MNRYISRILITLVLLVPASMRAHDPSKHKGKAVEGEIVSIAEGRFEMKTESGSVPVTFSSKTKFEHGSQAVTKDHLQKGERVSVFGTKLPTGELVAREVLIGAPKMDHRQKPKAAQKH